MKTCILLSTYNGEEYVREQIASILTQTTRPDFLIVRDDGSKDQTVAMIQEQCAPVVKDGMTVKIVQGENIGPEKSFRELFKLGLETDADIFFFCDQDDIWELAKIAAFVAEFPNSKTPEPRAVFCRLLLVDAQNTPIKATKTPRRVGFGNAIIENIMTGCGLACNRELLSLAAKGNIERPPIHDHWICVLATLLGSTGYIDKPLVRYRQHGSNVLGYSTSTVQSLKRKVTRVVKKTGYKKSTLAGLVLKEFGSKLNARDRVTLELIQSSSNSFIARIRLVFSDRLWRQNRLHGIFWRVLCLAGLF